MRIHHFRAFFSLVMAMLLLMSGSLLSEVAFADSCPHVNTDRFTNETYEQIIDNDSSHQMILWLQTVCLDCEKIISDEQLHTTEEPHHFVAAGSVMTCSWCEYRTTKDAVHSTTVSVPKPTVIPKPTATPVPALKSAPAACILDQSPRGISIQIPNLAHDDIKEIDIYRVCESGASNYVATLDYPKEKSCIDEALTADEKYTYYYSVECACSNQFPESQKASIRWTEYSRMSNLRVRQDPNDVRTIHVSWDDIPGAGYYIMIYQVNDDGEIGLWEWEEENGLCTTTHMSFHKALPRTTYVVSVHDSVTGRNLEETITISPAPDYTRYNAKCKGGTMYWYKRSDLDKGKNPWDSGAKLTKFSTISLKQFEEKIEDYELYGESDFLYQKASSDHYFEGLYILRGPNGDVAYEEYSDEFLEARSSNTGWHWYFSLDSLIRQLSGKKTLTEPGKYMFEVYFDGCRVSRKEFELTK